VPAVSSGRLHSDSPRGQPTLDLPLVLARCLASVALQVDAEPRDFYLFKVLRAHILPLTNCAFNKSGDRFITGSYDRTCKVREIRKPWRGV